jgi:hypothetical protein
MLDQVQEVERGSSTTPYSEIRQDVGGNGLARFQHGERRNPCHGILRASE